MCAIALSGCTSNTESVELTPFEGELMTFTLGSITRLANKNMWEVNDEIAIYRNDDGDTAPRKYKVVNSDGDLTSDNGWEYSYTYSNYRAVYPFPANEQTTYEEYIASLPTFSDSDTDYLITDDTYAENQYLGLLFSHAYASITITDEGSTSSAFTATIIADGTSKSVSNNESRESEFTLLAGDYTDNLTMTVLSGVYEMTITPTKYIYVGGVNYEVKITIE